MEPAIEIIKKGKMHFYGNIDRRFQAIGPDLRVAPPKRFIGATEAIETSKPREIIFSDMRISMISTRTTQREVITAMENLIALHRVFKDAVHVINKTPSLEGEGIICLNKMLSLKILPEIKTHKIIIWGGALQRFGPWPRLLAGGYGMQSKRLSHPSRLGHSQASQPYGEIEALAKLLNAETKKMRALADIVGKTYDRFLSMHELSGRKTMQEPKSNNISRVIYAPFIATGAISVAFPADAIQNQLLNISEIELRTLSVVARAYAASSSLLHCRSVQRLQKRGLHRHSMGRWFPKSEEHRMCPVNHPQAISESIRIIQRGRLSLGCNQYDERYRMASGNNRLRRMNDVKDISSEVMMKRKMEEDIKGGGVINEILRFLRESSRLTQKELAEEVNISYVTISDIENNKSNPKKETIDSYARFFGIDSYILHYLADPARKWSDYDQLFLSVMKAKCGQLNLSNGSDVEGAVVS